MVLYPAARRGKRRNAREKMATSKLLLSLERLSIYLPVWHPHLAA
jgi:hypothetical protein